MGKPTGQEYGRALHVDTQAVHTVSGKAAGTPCSCAVQQPGKQESGPSLSSVPTLHILKVLSSVSLPAERKVSLDALERGMNKDWEGLWAEAERSMVG